MPRSTHDGGSHAESPSLGFETHIWAQGYSSVAGLDEAGRGAWAGPVVAAAVILSPEDPALLEHLDGVRDSKQLTANRREALSKTIAEHAVALGVGCLPPEAIDSLGIVPSTRRAMALALQVLSPQADYLLIDYLPLPEQPLPQKNLTHGDRRVLSIAAASIVAKVHRDRLMVDLERLYPGYGFARHKGYGTPQHQAALAELGPCPAHRFSFAPLLTWARGKAAEQARER